MSENQLPLFESSIFSTDIYIHDIFPIGSRNTLVTRDTSNFVGNLVDNYISPISETIDRSFSLLFDEDDELLLDMGGTDIYIEPEEPNLGYDNDIDDMIIDLITPPPPPLEPHPESDFWNPIPCRLTNKLFDEILPTVIMSQSIRKKYNIEDPMCSICQESITTRQHSSILKCDHIYHKSCIKTWLTKTCEKPTCPCCRLDVR